MFFFVWYKFVIVCVCTCVLLGFEKKNYCEKKDDTPYHNQNQDAILKNKCDLTFSLLMAIIRISRITTRRSVEYKKVCIYLHHDNIIFFFFSFFVRVLFITLIPSYIQQVNLVRRKEEFLFADAVFFRIWVMRVFSELW